MNLEHSQQSDKRKKYSLTSSTEPPCLKQVKFSTPQLEVQTDADQTTYVLDFEYIKDYTGELPCFAMSENFIFFQTVCLGYKHRNLQLSTEHLKLYNTFCSIERHPGNRLEFKLHASSTKHDENIPISRITHDKGRELCDSTIKSLKENCIFFLADFLKCSYDCVLTYADREQCGKIRKHNTSIGFKKKSDTPDNLQSRHSCLLQVDERVIFYNFITNKKIWVASIRAMSSRTTDKWYIIDKNPNKGNGSVTVPFGTRSSDITIGRGAENDICLHKYPDISWCHYKIHIHKDCVKVENLSYLDRGLDWNCTGREMPMSGVNILTVLGIRWQKHTTPPSTGLEITNENFRKKLCAYMLSKPASLYVLLHYSDFEELDIKTMPAGSYINVNTIFLQKHDDTAIKNAIDKLVLGGVHNDLQSEWDANEAFRMSSIVINTHKVWFTRTELMIFGVYQPHVDDNVYVEVHGYYFTSDFMSTTNSGITLSVVGTKNTKFEFKLLNSADYRASIVRCPFTAS